MSTQIRKTTSKQKKAISSRERKSCTETGNAAVTELKEFSRSVGAGEDRGEFHVGRGVRGYPSSGVKQRVRELGRSGIVWLPGLNPGVTTQRWC